METPLKGREHMECNVYFYTYIVNCIFSMIIFFWKKKAISYVVLSILTVLYILYCI